ncbi:hypothetical protein D9M68_805240 [compost metagenome]
MVPTERAALFNGDVVALRHDIGKAVIDGDLHLDIGVVRQHLGQPGPEYGVDGMLGGRDANIASRLVAQIAQGRQLAVDFLEARGQGPQQALACLGGRYAAGGTGQQAQIKTGFEGANGVAQSRLRDAELGGGAGETAFPSHRHEGQQVVVVLAGHLSIYLMSMR